MNGLGKYIAILLFALYAAGVIAQPTHLLHKSYAEKYGYLDSLWQEAGRRGADTNKTRQMLKSIEQWAKKNDDDEFSLQLRLLSLRTGFLSGAPGAQLEKQIEEVAKYADEKKFRLVEADALKLLGDYWNGQKKYGRAFEYELTGYNIYSRISPEAFPPKQYYIYTLGMHYIQYGDDESAFRLMKQAETIVSKDNRYLNPLNNAIGLYYRHAKKYDSARLYFQKVYDRAVASGEQPWIGIAAGNIGSCYFYEKNYAAAIPLLEKDVEHSLSHKQLQNAVKSMATLAEIYFIQKDVDKAEKLLTHALTLGEGRDWWPNYKIAEQIFTLLSKVYAEKNNMRSAYLYSDSARIAKDSVDAQFNMLTITRAQEKAEMAERKLQVELLNSQKKMHELTRNVLLAGIVLLLVIGILFIYNQNLKQKKLRAELVVAGTELESFRQSIMDKNGIIEQFASEIERARNEHVYDTDVEILSQLQHAIILTDEQWEEFRIKFEKVHKNFFYNLKKKIPDLTQAEIRFLALTKLKLSSKEMAAMMGISPNTVRIYRHRLRRKLALDKEEMIEELVDDI